MKRLALPLAFLFVALLPACSPPSGSELVEQVIEQRNQYEARLNSWIVREDAAEPYLYLEVNVLNNSQESLQTLTVMVEQLDADNEMLRQDRVPIDVADLTPGLAESIGVEVRPAHPDVEGIRLFVESNPPEEAWGEFPEFERVRPRI